MSKEEDRLYKQIKKIFPLLSLRRNYRPDFLKNPYSNNNLEMDIYIKEFNIGFEYQGMVHFKDLKRYNNNSDKSRLNDIVKAKLIEGTHTKTLVEIFPSDLTGDILQNIILRIYNTIIHSINIKRSRTSIVRLIFLYLYIVMGFYPVKIKMRKNRIVYADNPKLKLTLPYGDIQDIGRLKSIEAFEKLIKKIKE